MSRLEDFRDWLQRKWCAVRGHARGRLEEAAVTNYYDGKEHYSSVIQCDYCGEVLKVLYSWTLPEGSEVIFPGEKRQKIVLYESRGGRMRCGEFVREEGKRIKVLTAPGATVAHTSIREEKKLSPLEACERHNRLLDKVEATKEQAEATSES